LRTTIADASRPACIRAQAGAGKNRFASADGCALELLVTTCNG